MAIDKRISSPAEAVADVADGATVLISGFGGAGFPNALIRALRHRGPKDLTLIVNSATHRYSLTHELIERDGAEVHGLGETALPPVPAAIGNALASLGAHLTELPMTPERVLEAL